MILFVERDIAVDMGTDTTLVYVAGKGIRLREPTVVAVDRQQGRLLRVGEEARKMGKAARLRVETEFEQKELFRQLAEHRNNLIDKKA